MSPIVITELEYRKGRAVFDASGFACIPAPEEEAALAAAIRAHGARHAVVGVARYTGELYRTLPRGAVLARYGVGHDGIDKDQATAHGILCVNTPEVLSQSVAEHAIALALAASRHIAESAAAMRAGEWQPAMGVELGGKTIAVVGCGPIGRRVAHIAASGFGMTVVGCASAPRPLSSLPAGHRYTRMARDIKDAVRGADYVSLHIPGVPATRNLIDAAVLACMSPGAILVNTSRGSVVDEPALYDALAAGGIAAAALDVFASEPYVPAGPARDLRRLPNVLMTPHISSSTREACVRAAERALRNIRQAEDGRYGEMDLLNPAVLPG